MKKRIEIIMFAYRNIIFAKILYVEPKLIGTLSYSSYLDDNNFSIRSGSCPAFGFSLYIWGTNRVRNNDVLLKVTRDNERALFELKGYAKCIDEVNKMSNRQLSDYIYSW